MLWAGLRLGSAIPEIRAKIAIGLSESSVSLMPSARDRLAINPRLRQVLENPPARKMPLRISPTLGVGCCDFGEGQCAGFGPLDLVNVCVAFPVEPSLSAAFRDAAPFGVRVVVLWVFSPLVKLERFTFLQPPTEGCCDGKYQ